MLDVSGKGGCECEHIAEVRGLSKSFGDNKVFENFNIQFRRGETTVILGPSGTGKSVLIRHFNGLMHPDAGEVWCCGQRVDQLTDRQFMPLRRRIGYLFQLGALFDSMTIGENVAFPLVEHTDLNRDEREALADYVLNLVGLAGKQRDFPGAVSGGQQRRVALARAVILRPEIMLYDEPTTGLDPITGDLISELIATLNQELNISGVVVTHDMACAKRVGNRLVLMHGGHVVADHTLEGFLKSDHLFVQSFLAGRASEADLASIRSAFTHPD